MYSVCSDFTSTRDSRSGNPRHQRVHCLVKALTQQVPTPELCCKYPEKAATRCQVGFRKGYLGEFWGRCVVQDSVSPRADAQDLFYFVLFPIHHNQMCL